MDVHPFDTTTTSATTRTTNGKTSLMDSPPAEDAAPVPPSLSSMSILSTDTLTNQAIDSRVPEGGGWNEQPPLLLPQQRKGVEETTTLLKGVRRSDNCGGRIGSAPPAYLVCSQTSLEFSSISIFVAY
jgi:hypothetical protein